MAEPDQFLNIAHPEGDGVDDSGDMGCVLTGSIWIPSGTGPFPCVIGTKAEGYTTGRWSGDGGLSLPEANAFTDLARAGFLCLYFDVRLMVDGSQGGGGLYLQSTDGRYPQPLNDFAQVVRYIRADPRCNGFVAAIGGDAAGQYALHNSLTGDDRVNAVVALSPITDMGSRVGTSARLISKFVDFGGSSSVSVLSGISPISQMDLTAAPIFHYNGVSEATPVAQLNDFREEAEALSLDYDSVLGTTLHSFAAWNLVRERAIKFLVKAYGDWTYAGGMTPIPELPILPGELEGYDWALAGGKGTVDGKTISGTSTSASLIGLEPGKVYTFSIRAKNIYGVGPWISTKFLSDRSNIGTATGHSKMPVGVTAYLVPIPSLSSSPVWTLPYITGVRMHYWWSGVQPTSATSFNWTVLDEFVQLCLTNSKTASISIQVGTGLPPWAISAGVETWKDATGAIRPQIWKPNFLAKWTTFVNAFGVRYGAHPSISHIVMGGNGSIQGTAQAVLILSSSPYAGVDYALLNGLAKTSGFNTLADAWIYASKSILSMFTKAFPVKTIVSDLYDPVPLGTAVKDGRVAIQEYLTYLQTLPANILDGIGVQAEQIPVALGEGLPELCELIANQTNLQIAFRTNRITTTSAEFQFGMDGALALFPREIEIPLADAVKADPYPDIIYDTASVLRGQQ